MSSKRRLRRKACQGKIRHATEGVAWCAVRKLGAPGMHAYRCPHCGAWHVGHRRGAGGLISKSNLALLA
jgi:hypothetical protein